MNGPASVRQFFRKYFSKCTTSRSMLLLEMPMRQHTSTTNVRSTKICTIQLPLCWERCNLRSVRDAHLKADFTLIILSMFILLSLAQQVILIVPLWLISDGENHLDPGWRENSGATLVSEHGITRKNKLTTARTPRRLKACRRRRLGRTIQNPVDNPMIALQDYVLQSGRVLELQNRDLWKRPTDLSWHFPILVTIRESPFKHFRGRSPAKLKATEDKIEEAKEQKTLNNRDEEWNSTRSKQSSWTWNIIIFFCLARVELRRDARASSLPISCMGQLSPGA